MPLLARLLGYITNHPVVLSGPWSLSQPLSLTLNAVGFLFLAFASITFNFPVFAPVTKDSMNYTSAAIGVIGLISIATWLTTGRKRFTGPGDIGVAKAPSIANEAPGLTAGAVMGEDQVSEKK